MSGLFGDPAALCRFVAGTGLILILFVLSIIDFFTRRLPDRIVFPILATGLTLNCAGVFTNPADALGGAAAGYCSLWIILRINALRRDASPAFGGGDLKLAAAIGAWLGLLAVPAVLLIAFVTGTLAVAPALLSGRLRRTQTVPFGPALALGGATVLVMGKSAIWHFLGD